VGFKEATLLKMLVVHSPLKRVPEVIRQYGPVLLTIHLRLFE
jgi:hypothetical protein